MSRILTDWLTHYENYTSNTESAPIFNRWVGISMIAAVLRKKVWFRLGRLRIHPNLYIVLVSEPGVGRKSSALSYGNSLVGEISMIQTSADSITPQALVNDLSLGTTSAQMPNGINMEYSALTIISGEFESFLGQKKENTRMLVTLTDLYDTVKPVWENRTKSGGSEKVPAPFLNLVAATTPESLASSFPVSAIGGGLSARIIFVSYGGPVLKVAEPELTDLDKKLGSNLVRDLELMSRITGHYYFDSPETRQKWHNWYNDYDFISSTRICQEKAFNGWYSRKGTQILKLCQVVSAARSSDRLVVWEDFERSLSFLEEVEHHMGDSFRAVGRSEFTADIDALMDIIKGHKGGISETHLLQLVWKDMDFEKFRSVIKTPIHSGKVKRFYKHPKTNKQGIFYFWVDNLPEELQEIKPNMP